MLKWAIFPANMNLTYSVSVFTTMTSDDHTSALEKTAEHIPVPTQLIWGQADQVSPLPTNIVTKSISLELMFENSENPTVKGHTQFSNFKMFQKLRMPV